MTEPLPNLGNSIKHFLYPGPLDIKDWKNLQLWILKSQVSRHPNQTDVCLVLNQSENCKYNPNSVETIHYSPNIYFFSFFDKQSHLLMEKNICRN